jgi:hypothetical protein
MQAFCYCRTFFLLESSLFVSSTGNTADRFLIKFQKTKLPRDKVEPYSQKTFSQKSREDVPLSVILITRVSAKCPDGWVGTEVSCYKLGTNKLPFEQAAQDCKTQVLLVKYSR